MNSENPANEPPEDGPPEEGREETPSPARGGWKAAARKTLIIAGITFLLLVVSLEILGRISPDVLGYDLYVGPGMTEPDPLLGKRLKRGARFGYTIRNFEGLPPGIGLRDNGIVDPHAPRILALGDSFTFGQFVQDDQTWPEVLERSLGATVINAGMPGSGTRYSRGFVDHCAPGLEPDVVLYAFFAGNDISDAASDVDRRLGGIRHWFHEHSTTYRIVKNTFNNLHLLGSDTEIRFHWAPVAGKKLRFWPSAIEFNSRIERSPRFQKGFGSCRKNILEMDGLCRERGVVFGVAILPFKEQVYFEQAKEGLDDPQAFDPLEPNRTLAVFCRRHGIPVADLLSRFIENNGSILYLPADSHWNAAGHRLASEALEPFARALLESARP